MDKSGETHDNSEEEKPAKPEHRLAKKKVAEVEFEDISVGDQKPATTSTSLLTPNKDKPENNQTIYSDSPTRKKTTRRRGRIFSMWCVCFVVGVLTLGSLATTIYLWVGRNMQRSIGGVEARCELLAVGFTWKESTCGCGAGCSFACRVNSCISVTVAIVDAGKDSVVGDSTLLNTSLASYDIDPAPKCFSSSSFPPCYDDDKAEIIGNCTFPCYYPADSPLPPPSVGLKRKFSRQEQLVAVACIGLIVVVIIVAGLCMWGRRGGDEEEGDGEEEAIGEKRPILGKAKLRMSSASTSYIV